MANDKDRLVTAQWVLERNLAWVAAAEVKVAVIVAIDTALLGSVGVAYAGVNAADRTPWAYIWAVSAGFGAAAGIFCAAVAVLPRRNGPAKSLVFFGLVGSLDQAEYFEKFKDATETELLEDWTAQIHRNAQIAGEKFSWVRVSMFWSFISVLPWFASILTLLRK